MPESFDARYGQKVPSSRFLAASRLSTALSGHRAYSSFADADCPRAKHTYTSQRRRHLQRLRCFLKIQSELCTRGIFLFAGEIPVQLRTAQYLRETTLSGSEHYGPIP